MPASTTSNTGSDKASTAAASSVYDNASQGTAATDVTATGGDAAGNQQGAATQGGPTLQESLVGRDVRDIMGLTNK